MSSIKNAKHHRAFLEGPRHASHALAPGPDAKHEFSIVITTRIASALYAKR